MTRFEHTTDVASGDWIAPRLRGGFGSVGIVCPTGFEAYARVFHPVDAGDGSTRTWAEVCAATGRTPHPLMQWNRISHGWNDGAPTTGALDADHLAVLAGAIGDDAAITVGLWHGYGFLHPGSTSSFALAFHPGDGAPPEPAPAATAGVQADFGVDARSTPTLVLPDREYLLFRGHLGALRDPGWRVASGWAWRWVETVNLAWPDDRSWFVASEIDFDSTIVGGSRELVDRVLSSSLETAEVTAASDLSSEGDVVND